MLIPMPSILTKVMINSSISTTSSSLTSQDTLLSCSYCQKKTCHCSSTRKILNCSSYLLNLTFDSNCAKMILWKTVDFSSRNLVSLDLSSLLLMRMSHLILKSNSISNIHEKTFDSVGDILIELDLQINQLSALSSKWFNSKLRQLKILNLASNQLESFTQLNHLDLPYLQILNLSRNQIEIFPRQIQQLKSLVTLDLSFNKLSSIPKFALMGLNDLRWLSLASNRDLTCIIQDSFKYVKSLNYLDLSSTYLFDLDGCIFIQLTGLRKLKIEHVSINCSSCWLPIAKTNSIALLGECLDKNQIQRLDTLTDKQIHDSCSKSSINCSSNYCEPVLFNFQYKSVSYEQVSDTSESSNQSKSRAIAITLGIIFSIIASIIIMTTIIVVYRWKQGKELLCCDFRTTTSSTVTEITQRHRRQHQKKIINKNPTAIESIITHGANMNVPSYPSHHNDAYSSETTSNTKRKLYNPMFTDSPKSNLRYHLSGTESNDNSQNNRSNMSARYHLNTDHWSKMRMNVIKNTINIEQRGRVLSWEKHQKRAVQDELKAAIHGARSLPRNDVVVVHNFGDIFTVELDRCVPGSTYFCRRTDRRVESANRQTKQPRYALMTGSQYTLMTLPTNPQSNQTRSRVPVLQCRGKI
ncbi:unnamed protein product [Rotaria magnacalcarata]